MHYANRLTLEIEFVVRITGGELQPERQSIIFATDFFEYNSLTDRPRNPTWSEALRTLVFLRYPTPNNKLTGLF